MRIRGRWSRWWLSSFKAPKYILRIRNGGTRYYTRRRSYVSRRTDTGNKVDRVSQAVRGRNPNAGGGQEDRRGGLVMFSSLPLAFIDGPLPFKIAHHDITGATHNLPRCVEPGSPNISHLSQTRHSEMVQDVGSGRGARTKAALL